MRLPGALLGVLLGVTVPTLGQVTVTNNNPLPYGSVGVTYSAQLTATPVGQPYQWSIIQGNLPPGLNLNAQTGEIAGMPTVGGTQTFTVRALSPQQQSGTKQLSIGILQISNPSPLPGATLGTFYSITFNTSDGPASAIYTWQPGQPPPPPGLTLATSGVLSGTPSGTGTFNFQVFVFDQKDGIQATKNFSITVAGSLVITTPSPLPNADANSPYKATLDATGGTTPYHWNVLSGLPLGLNLDPNAGIVSGTPLNPGQFSFSVQVIDSANSAGTKTFSLTINQALKINGSFPSGTVGLAYSQAISAIGGQSPYTFSVQSTPFNPNPAPPGLGLSAGGVLSGVPTTAGSYNFGVLLTDGIGAQVSMPFALTVNPPLAFSTPSPLPSGTVGAAYSQPIMATGGTPPYTFSITTPPPGLTLDASGVLSGTPTAAGTFQFNVTVTDGARTSVVKAFQISVVGGVVAMLQVSPLSLAFTASVGGDSPAPQTISVTPVDANTATFTLTIEGAPAGTAAPAWISARPSVVGTAPARVIIGVNQGSMQAGNYSARVRIMDASQNSYIVSVSLTVTNVAPQLEVTPNFLRFAARFQTPGTLEQTITVRNSGGGGDLGFSTSVLNASSWISSVIPASGQTARNTFISVKVRIGTQGLKVGSYRDVIRFTFTGGIIDVPVTVFVADNGAIIGVSVTGLRFQARQGGGYSNTQTIQVYNLGDPATTVNWKAEIVTGANWLVLSPSSGTAFVSSPGNLSFSLTQDATQLPPGGYYALVRILDSQSRNSPRYVMAVLDLASSAAPPLPDPSPVGLLFTGVAGGAQPASQVVRVHTSSSQVVTWTAAALTSDGVAWISLSPSVGRSTGQSPGILLISVNTIGLAPGIYTGEVSIAIAGGPIRTVSITLIVLPGATATPAAAATPSASCTPSKLALTQTGLVNNFAVPAKWPANLIVLLNDDCGASILNGSVAASFSNGDAPLTLRGDTQMGTYSATWQAGVVTQQMVVTIHAEAGSLQPATAQLIGTINPNTAPVLFKNGTVNVFNRVSGGALAPGTIVEVYGTGLASGTATLGVLPLPNIFNGTIVVIGGFQVPLYYLSDGQLDAEIAVDLPANQQHAIVVSANGALTLPDQIDVVPVQLGVAAYSDGHAIAQHGVDFSYVTASSPAKPGEVLVIYLSGMGPTNPAVKSGDPAPGLEPLARVTLPPTVMVDNQNADVAFAGLSPGFVGLYQVNFTVPPTAKNGDLTLVLVQNGVTANITKLPVAK